MPAFFVSIISITTIIYWFFFIRMVYKCYALIRRFVKTSFHFTGNIQSVLQFKWLVSDYYPQRLLMLQPMKKKNRNIVTHGDTCFHFQVIHNTLYNFIEGPLKLFIDKWQSDCYMSIDSDCYSQRNKKIKNIVTHASTWWWDHGLRLAFADDIHRYRCASCEENMLEQSEVASLRLRTLDL